MTVPAMKRASVLEFFRANKQDPLFQYLTWYLILVKEWSLEDIYSLKIGPWREGVWGSREAHFNFVFNDGRGISLTIVKNGDTYYVDVSIEIADYKHVPNAETIEAEIIDGQ